MRILHEPAAWGVQADFATVSAHPAATRFSSSWFLSARRSWAVVVDAIVVLTQHRQVRGFRVSAVFVCVDVVDLASIGRHIAVRPRTHQTLESHDVV